MLALLSIKTRRSVVTPFAKVISPFAPLTLPLALRAQFLVGLAFLDAANSNIMTLLPVYAMQQLGVEDPSSLAGVVMLMCIPGAIITKKYQGKLGSRMCLQVSKVTSEATCRRSEAIVWNGAGASE